MIILKVPVLGLQLKHRHGNPGLRCHRVATIWECGLHVAAETRETRV